jgi:hypothetical protein
LPTTLVQPKLLLPDSQPLNSKKKTEFSEDVSRETSRQSFFI